MTYNTVIKTNIVYSVYYKMKFKLNKKYKKLLKVNTYMKGYNPRKEFR